MTASTPYLATQPPGCLFGAIAMLGQPPQRPTPQQLATTDVKDRTAICVIRK